MSSSDYCNTRVDTAEGIWSRGPGQGLSHYHQDLPTDARVQGLVLASGLGKFLAQVAGAGF